MSRVPVVVGGACVDLKGMPRHALIAGTSNIGRLERRPGGVAFNVAGGLARLGCRPVLVAMVGLDAEGDYLLDQCARLGIVPAVERVPDEATATYLAILDERGNLAVGIAAMDVCERLTVEVLERHEAMLREAPLVIADTNLPAAPLDWLRQRCLRHHVPLWVDPAAADKCDRFPHDLSGITYLSPNEEELAALGTPQALLQRGVRNVIVTLGPEGVQFYNGSQTTHYPSRAVPIADVTGAGDAFVAGAAWALLQGEALGDAIARGIAASLVAIQAYDSVPNLAPELLA